eukprot:jgi/Mesvir1/14668/Mv05334-RA.1
MVVLLPPESSGADFSSATMSRIQMNSAGTVTRGVTEEQVRNSARARAAKPAATGWSSGLFLAIAAVAVIALVIWKPWNRPGDGGGGECVTGMVCGSETAPFGGGGDVGGMTHSTNAFRMGQASGVTSGMLSGDYDSTFSSLPGAS